MIDFQVSSLIGLLIQHSSKIIATPSNELVTQTFKPTNKCLILEDNSLLSLDLNKVPDVKITNYLCTNSYLIPSICLRK